jgi:metallo-beta-lactamase family protein
MRIHFNGAAQTVTGSQHLLEINGRRVLLECGMFQGRRAETYTRNRSFSFDVRSLDAVVLSHAHIDHSGNLPNLIKQGYEGPIYATPATVDLAKVMLLDSGHIQEADAQYVTRKRDHHNGTRVEPLYTQLDARKVDDHFVAMPYKQSFSPVPGLTVTFFDAGHILGSAGMALDVEEPGRRFRLWFSGDIGREKLPLLEDPTLPQGADYLLMESTYGDTPHRDPEEAFAKFREVLLRTVQRGGKVIVPAFSVGRTQELVYFLNQIVSDGEIHGLPVYVDSPLAVNASDIFKQHRELFDEETQRFIQENRHPALDFKGLTYIRSVEESKALNGQPGPMVIISASGMAETGRILHHLKNNIENPKNTVMIVSWQAPDTLGRRLVEGQPWVKIFGETYRVRSEVVSIDGLSAHAGQNMLVKYAQSSQASLRKIFLVHGEADAAEALKVRLEAVGLHDVYYPSQFSTDDL